MRNYLRTADRGPKGFSFSSSSTFCVGTFGFTAEPKKIYIVALLGLIACAQQRELLDDHPPTCAYLVDSSYRRTWFFFASIGPRNARSHYVRTCSHIFNVGPTAVIPQYYSIITVIIMTTMHLSPTHTLLQTAVTILGIDESSSNHSPSKKMVEKPQTALSHHGLTTNPPRQNPFPDYVGLGWRRHSKQEDDNPASQF